MRRWRRHRQLKSKNLSALLMQMKEDHFVKVRGMIKDMMAKLEADASAEADQKQWCDTEMEKAMTKRDTNTGNVEGDTAQIAESTAAINEKEEEVQTLLEEISALTKGLNEATELRVKEKAENEKTVADSEAGLAGVNSLLVLRLLLHPQLRSLVEALGQRRDLLQEGLHLLLLLVDGSRGLRDLCCVSLDITSVRVTLGHCFFHLRVTPLLLVCLCRRISLELGHHVFDHATNLDEMVFLHLHQQGLDVLALELPRLFLEVAQHLRRRRFLVAAVYVFVPLQERDAAHLLERNKVLVGRKIIDHLLLQNGERLCNSCQLLGPRARSCVPGLRLGLALGGEVVEEGLIGVPVRRRLGLVVLRDLLGLLLLSQQLLILRLAVLKRLDLLVARST